jgi:hypothetical protein
MCDISSGSSASPTKRSVANVLIVFSERVIDIAKRVAVFICDCAVIIDNHAVRSTKIGCGLNSMNRSSELPALNAEPIIEPKHIISVITLMRK